MFVQLGQYNKNNMKQNQITLIIISFILVALMATNPSTEEHKEAIKEKVSAAIENNNSNGNAFQKLGQTIGIALIDKMIKRENYIIFSLTKVKLLDEYKNEKVVGYGIFGKVYLTNDFNENTGFSGGENFAKKDTAATGAANIEYNNIEHNKSIIKKFPDYIVSEDDATDRDGDIVGTNDIIGKPIKIGNLEIAQNDFPKEMKWEDAKKACENLGSGWRLPTKEELNTLYLNKDKIGGFADNYYWSSTEFGNGNAWAQDINNGGQYYYDKVYAGYVRAIRAF